jgi:hypothetical protein
MYKDDYLGLINELAASFEEAKTKNIYYGKSENYK